MSSWINCLFYSRFKPACCKYANDLVFHNVTALPESAYSDDGGVFVLNMEHRKKHVITQDQQNFRDKILKKKSPTYKPTLPFAAKLPKTTTFQYMKNCMYWIEEYTREGDNKKAIDSIKYLSVHCRNLITELNSTP